MKIVHVKNDKKLIVDINALNNLTREQIERIKLALNLMIDVLNSDQFREEFLRLKFKGPDINRNAEIYNMLISGATEYGGPDSDIDIDVTYYYRWWSRVIGYGLPGTIRTWINGKFFASMSLASLSGHLAHEYFHKLNLDDNYGTKSVPYQVGDLVARLAKQKI